MDLGAGTLDDRELLTRVREGDDHAYGVLWQRYETAARRCAHHVTRSGDDLDDVVAEAFAKVLHAIRGGAGPTDAFQPYLLTAVRRTAWRRNDARRRNPLPLDLDDERGIADITRRGEPEDDEEGFACAAWRSLPPRWQTALWHTTIQGRSTAELGEILGLSANAAAALVIRARDGLRRAYLAAQSAPSEPDPGPAVDAAVPVPVVAAA